MSVSSKPNDNREFNEAARRSINRVAKATGMSTGEIGAMVSSFFAEVDHQLAGGREVEIPGFGVFVLIVPSEQIIHRRSRSRRLWRFRP